MMILGLPYSSPLGQEEQLISTLPAVILYLYHEISRDFM